MVGMAAGQMSANSDTQNCPVTDFTLPTAPSSSPATLRKQWGKAAIATVGRAAVLSFSSRPHSLPKWCHLPARTCRITPLKKAAVAFTSSPWGSIRRPFSSEPKSSPEMSTPMSAATSALALTSLKVLLTFEQSLRTPVRDNSRASDDREISPDSSLNAFALLRNNCQQG